MSSSSSDESVPLSQSIKRKHTKINFNSDSDYDSDDALSKQSRKKKKSKKHKHKNKNSKIKINEEESEESDEDEAISKKLERKKKKKKAKEQEVKKETDSVLNTIKKEESTDSIKTGDEDSKEDSYKWWEDENSNGEGWKSLVHNGVMFPPEYKPLPSHIKLYYDNQPVELPPEAEEVAGFYAALLETDHGKNPVFQKNFFHDFLQVLKENNGTLNGIAIKSFDKCDFSKIHAYFELLKEEKRNMSAQEKKQLRLEKQKEEEPYKFCELNGRKEQVGNFRVEPPDLFRGRGKHPKTGKLKRRVQPEDIVLNLSKDAPIPIPPEGHKWGEIRHDPTVQWLAMWRENILDSFKYVRLAANSSLKGQSDLKKFEKARELKNHIDTIRRDYKRNLKSKLMLERQKAVAIYLIDVFALRAGGEKSEDEADTVGCCSLRYEHVTLQPPNIVVFDFLGKDSIRFYQEVEVDKQVFKDLIIFKRPPKQPGHQLFDRLDPSILNKFLQSYMPGLTAKVFRTYNASKTMQDQLDLIPNEGTVAEKLLRYNAANRTVAILCNHQRTVTKGHAQSVQKANTRIKELIWQRIRLKKGILQLDKKQRKKNPKFFAEIDDLTKEDETEIHERIIERETEKYHRKFLRENDKRKFEEEELLEDKVLNEWLEKVETLKEEFAQEIKTGKVEIKPNLNTIEKLEKQIERLDLRIETSSIQLKDKQENSEVSLGTSKINYIDPRLSVVFCKKFGVPIEKIFTKALREKFAWAIESVDENWRF